MIDVNKKELYETSGHWDHYRENMFLSKTEEGERLIDARDRGIGEKSSGQQSQACFEVADHYIYNNGSLEELRDKVERLLVKLGIFD